MTGNKGEWSELYVLLKLLADRKLYCADADLKKLNDVYFPIIEIFRDEDDRKQIIYKLAEDDRPVEIYLNGHLMHTIDRNTLKGCARSIYEKIIMAENKGSFEIKGSEAIMNDICTTKIKAPSSDKTDIKMRIYDLKTGYNVKTGFSIKSELGAAPTLLNASGATNFIYEVQNISDEQMEKINDINTKSKVNDRMNSIGSVKFVRAANSTFAGNLMLIDSMMDEIISYMLLDYYKSGTKDMLSIVKHLEEKDPIKYYRNGIYRFKIKKLLSSIALGMVPSKVWNGMDEANGGYIIVKSDGDVLAYHLYNRDFFETYLLNNTILETGSTKKHGFASLYKENDHMYINLNLQIRFK